jgi:hypothetical protein
MMVGLFIRPIRHYLKVTDIEMASSSRKFTTCIGSAAILDARFKTSGPD